MNMARSRLLLTTLNSVSSCSSLSDFGSGFGIRRLWPFLTGLAEVPAPHS